MYNGSIDDTGKKGRENYCAHVECSRIDCLVILRMHMDEVIQLCDSRAWIQIHNDLLNCQMAGGGAPISNTHKALTLILLIRSAAAPKTA